MYKTPLLLFSPALSFIVLLNILTTMRAFLLLLVNFLGLVTSQSPQYQESPRNAAILSDTRYLSGDGTFGASYKQEDGVEFKEESDEFGNRRGSYSYIDPTGERRTVTYTAGKDGFQASGDHIPTAAPQVAPEPVQPEYVPLPQYNPPDYQFPKERFYDSRFESQNRYQPATESPRKPESRVRFQLNPSSLRYQPPIPEYEHQYQAQYQPQHQPRKYQSPQYQPSQYEPELPQYEAPQYQKPQYSPPYRPPSPVFEYRPLSKSSPYNQITTPAPRRFYPPGKLDFNRTPDGFSYTFSKT